MSTLQQHVPAPAAPQAEEPQAHDNYVLATRFVHRAETMLPAAEGHPVATAWIEAAFAAALAVTAESSWSEVRKARELLDAAQHALDQAGYRLR